MSSALRVGVPLNSMCSTKCAIPLRGSASWREPRVSHTPMLTERTWGIVSVMRRRPVSRTSRVTIACCMTVTDCRERNYRKPLQGGYYHAPPLECKRVQPLARPWRAAEKPCWTPALQLKVRGSPIMFNRHDLAEMELTELEQALDSMGHPRFHARQLYQWVHKRGVTDFAGMTDLGRELRSALASAFRIVTPEVVRREQSSDGTAKFLLRLEDRHLIESVFIPDTPANTFCLSTQVGCAMKCGFCLTGKMGIIRNLTAGEIAGQVRVLTRELGMLQAR